jgi:hypothetical protein
METPTTWTTLHLVQRQPAWTEEQLILLLPDVLWRPNQVYLAIHHQGNGHSYVLRPVLRQNSQRMMSRWTKVQRGFLQLGSKGLFNSTSTGTAYSRRLLHCRDPHVPCVYGCRPSPPAWRYVGGSTLPFQRQKGGELQLLCMKGWAEMILKIVVFQKSWLYHHKVI